jgi:hypothetical protein
MDSALLIGLLRAVLCLVHSSSKCDRISWNQPDLKIPGNGNKCRFELVILNIISIWRLSLTSNNLVCSDQPDERRVQQSRRNGLSGTSSGACPE